MDFIIVTHRVAPPLDGRCCQCIAARPTPPLDGCRLCIALPIPIGDGLRCRVSLRHPPPLDGCRRNSLRHPPPFGCRRNVAPPPIGSTLSVLCCIDPPNWMDFSSIHRVMSPPPIRWTLSLCHVTPPHWMDVVFTPHCPPHRMDFIVASHRIASPIGWTSSAWRRVT
jgi:hypothetical protein